MKNSILMTKNKKIGHTSSCQSISPHRWVFKTSHPAVFSCGYLNILRLLKDLQPLQETLASGLQWR